MSKLKIKLTTAEQGVSPQTRAYLEQYKVEFDPNGFADAPLVPVGSLYYSPGASIVPINAQVKAYQTLNSRHYYYTSISRPKVERKHLVPYTVYRVSIMGEDVRITRYSIVRGSEVAEQVQEDLSYCKIRDLHPRYRLLVDFHTSVVREKMLQRQLRKEQKGNSRKVA